MALKVRIQLNNVMVIDVISTMRGNVKITVPSLGLQKEFRFEAKNLNTSKPAMTIFNGDEKYADSITEEVTIHGLEKGAAPQIHIACLAMIGVAGYSKDKSVKFIYQSPPDMTIELTRALREALQ